MSRGVGPPPICSNAMKRGASRRILPICGNYCACAAEKRSVRALYVRPQFQKYGRYVLSDVMGKSLTFDALIRSPRRRSARSMGNTEVWRPSKCGRYAAASERDFGSETFSLPFTDTTHLSNAIVTSSGRGFGGKARNATRPPDAERGAEPAFARQVKASFSGDFRSEKVGYGEDKC